MWLDGLGCRRRLGSGAVIEAATSIIPVVVVQWGWGAGEVGEMAERSNADHADLNRLEPPLIPLAAMVGGVILNLAWPFPVAPELVGTVLGTVAIVLGIGTALWAIRTMQAAGVDVSPDTSTAAIVDRGPYGRSRNPIYLAGLLVAVGVALHVNSGWGLLLTAVAAAVMHFRIVAREERYLSSKFGDEYVAYQRRVRRWV